MIKIAAAETELLFANNNIALVNVQNRTICIGKYQQQLFAFARNCPHAGIFLDEGWIDERGQVVCPLHQYKFSLKTGLDTSGDYYMKRWNVVIKEEGIYLDTDFI